MKNRKRVSTVFFLIAALVWRVCLADTPSGASAEPGHNVDFELRGHNSLDLVWIGALGMWVGRYEVANDQYKLYNMAHKGELFYKRNIFQDRQPVVNVSWYDAVNFCSWLNSRLAGQIPDGFEFRLPSEVEWETFASCGDDRKYPWGDEWPPPSSFNYRGEEGDSFLFRIFEHGDIIKGHNDGFIVSAPVEESGVNDWGLFGVGGNVWEWCLDLYSEEYDERVLKGGAWNNYWPPHLEIRHRSGTPAAWKNPMIGFRVVLGPIQLR